MNDHRREDPSGAPPNPEQVPKYKIGTVASLVGVTPNVLRAWERRYDIPRPARQSGKQRLYTDQDVSLLRRIVETIRRGLSISEVVALGRESLLGLPAPTLPRAAPALAKSASSLAIPDNVRGRVWGLAGDLSTPDRPRRYAGEGLEVSVRALALPDLGALHRIYQIVKGLYELWTYMEQQTVADILKRRLSLFGDAQLRSQIAQFGAATSPREPLLEAAIHDAREGALALLLEHFRELDASRVEQAQFDLLISLCRDHAKVLRNAFGDLDPALREADEHLKAHQVVPILSKIEHLRSGGWVGAVGSDFHGFITCRCLETSTLDRLLYRCLALFRAGRGARPPSLWVTERANGWVRWVFEAPTGAAQIMEPGTFLALVVGLAAGIAPEQALARGYLGARRMDGRDWLWFHWPSYDPPSDVSRCRCHPLS